MRQRGAGGERVSGLLLGLALLLGAIRFVRLGEWSLWLDEAYTLCDSLHEGAVSNPLGYGLWRVWIGLLADRPDELWLRLPGAVLGWLSLPLAYWAFRPFAGARCAAATALLLAVSPWHLHWSQHARFYTLAQDLVLLGGGLALRGLWGRSIGLHASGLVVAVLGGLAHPSAAMGGVALALAPLLATALKSGVPLPPRKAYGWLWAILVVGGLISLPWLQRLLYVHGVKKGGGTPAHFVLTTGFYLTPLLGLGAFVGFVWAWLRQDAFGRLAALIALVMVGGMAAAASFYRVNAQYVFFALPWILLLATLPASTGEAPVWGQERAAERVGSRLKLAWVALLALPSLSQQALYMTDRYGERPRWREAYREVWNRREPGDLVLGMEGPVAQYYLSPSSTDLRRVREVVWLNDWNAWQSVDWARSARRTWIVVNLEQLEDWPAERHEARELLLGSLREDCRLVRHLPVRAPGRDQDVYVYLRDPAEL